MIVLDASVVLAALLSEPGGEVFAGMAEDYRISVFNLGEVASRLSEKGHGPQQIRAAIAPLIPNCAPLSIEQVLQVGIWRKDTRRLGLSMGDRCCLALGLDMGAEVWTADRAWATLDLGVKIRVIR